MDIVAPKGEQPWKCLIGSAFGLEVYIVDDEYVKTTYDMDFTEGANPEAKPYVPEGERWISSNVPREKLKHVLGHEVLEPGLQKMGMSYDQAHEVANGWELGSRLDDEAAEKQLQGMSVGQEDGNMPEPKSGESEQDFVSRCVPIVMHEGATQDQALGKCYGIYRNATKAVGTVDTMADAAETRKFNDSETAAKDHAGERELQPGDGQPGSGKKIIPGDEGIPKAADKVLTRMQRIAGAVQKAMIMRAILKAGPRLKVDPVKVYEAAARLLRRSDAKAIHGIGDVQAEEADKDASTTLGTDN